MHFHLPQQHPHFQISVGITEFLNQEILEMLGGK
jgi:hypothetical protein